MITTVIVNAQKKERDRLSSLLSVQGDIRVLAHGKDGYDALKFIGSLKPDIAIIDTHLEFIDGEEIPPLLKARSPSTAVVILTSRISDQQLYKAVYNEVSGFVHKETDIDKFPWILKCISRGECFISPYFAAKVLHLFSFINWNSVGLYLPMESPSVKKPPKRSKDRFPNPDDPAGYLSKTELMILARIGEGSTSSEIARELDLAVGTVRNYISGVMRKARLSSRSQMVRCAFRYGLVGHP